MTCPEEFFTRLYRDHREPVFRQALALTKLPEPAHDLTQEVFIKCWLNISKFETINDIQAYLFILTRNLYISTWRNQRREQIGLSEYSRYYKQLYPPTDDPVQEKEYRKLVERAISDLPLRQQQVFILRKELSLRRTAVARELKISESTVKIHLARAVRAIKGKIEMNLDMQLKPGPPIEN